MSDEDISGLWAYLPSHPPVKEKTKAKELHPNYRLPGVINIGRWMEFPSGEYKKDPTLNEQENKGRYVSQSVAYCDQCHTPRSRLGRLVKKYYMAGGSNPGKFEVPPKLDNPHGKRIGTWSSPDIIEFLTSGKKTMERWSITIRSWQRKEKTAILFSRMKKKPRLLRISNLFLLSISIRHNTNRSFLFGKNRECT